jgi:uncharacterized protein
MPTVFVDSGAWIALLNARDGRHARALELFRGLPARTHLVTTNYVVAETVTWFVYHGYRDAAFRMRDMVLASEQQRLLSLRWVTESVQQEAWSYLERFSDQRFSFYDCASFAVASTDQVDFVFGFDNDFRIAGFDLRPGPTDVSALHR